MCSHSPPRCMHADRNTAIASSFSMTLCASSDTHYVLDGVWQRRQVRRDHCWRHRLVTPCAQRQPLYLHSGSVYYGVSAVISHQRSRFQTQERPAEGASPRRGVVVAGRSGTVGRPNVLRLQLCHWSSGRMSCGGGNKQVAARRAPAPCTASPQAPVMEPGGPLALGDFRFRPAGCVSPAHGAGQQLVTCMGRCCSSSPAVCCVLGHPASAC